MMTPTERSARTRARPAKPSRHLRTAWWARARVRAHPPRSLAADQHELAVGLVGDHIPRADELPDRAVLRDRSRRPAREDPVRVAVPRGVRRERGGREGDGAARA